MLCLVSRRGTVLRSVMPVETYPVDVDVQSSTGLPILVAGESAQNIVEIPTVLEHVICSGDGACGIQSGATGAYVHRPGNILSHIRGTDCEAIAELCKEDSDADVVTAVIAACFSCFCWCDWSVMSRHLLFVHHQRTVGGCEPRFSVCGVDRINGVSSPGLK